ncbi:hypothetical protein DFP72DRAFT_840276 [Ephemerocybe angulata]|uniref:Uncharacterized protein n=1 Tax=Ephemerocybe angulata TaxID=980116 RepID=A0A8H6IFS7_9AGAR|nr:hypothetical protein DFP72DRAFT_840276 [Tulosesus angulatus]
MVSELATRSTMDAQPRAELSATDLRLRGSVDSWSRYTTSTSFSFFRVPNLQQLVLSITFLSPTQDMKLSDAPFTLISIASSPLDPRAIAKNFELTGQETPAKGQVASLTSTNHFISYCLTVTFLSLMGSKESGERCLDPAGEPFDIVVNVKNFATGQFVNAKSNYVAAPQQLDSDGLILGHSHITIDRLISLIQTTPTDPTKFAFFKVSKGASHDSPP